MLRGIGCTDVGYTNRRTTDRTRGGPRCDGDWRCTNGAMTSDANRADELAVEIRPGVFRPDWSLVTTEAARQALAGRVPGAPACLSVGRSRSILTRTWCGKRCFGRSRAKGGHHDWLKSPRIRTFRPKVSQRYCASWRSAISSASSPERIRSDLPTRGRRNERDIA